MALSYLDVSPLILLYLFLVFLLLIPLLWFIYEKSKRKTFTVSPGIQNSIVEKTDQEWILYHNNFSLCSRKIRILLDEQDVYYQSRHIDLIETGKYQTLSREFLGVNPEGTVPVLLHFGKPVYESHEQLLYLAKHLTKAKVLLPNEDKKVDIMKYWIDKSSLKGKPDENLINHAGNCVALLTPLLFTCMINYIPFNKIMLGLLFHPEKQRVLIFLAMKYLGLKLFKETSHLETLIIKSFEIMNQHLSDLEELLAGHNGAWIIPDQYTLADVSWIVILHRLEELQLLPLLINNKKHVNDYYKRGKERPSFNEAIIKHSNLILEKGLKDLNKEITKKSSIASIHKKLKILNE